VIVGKPSACSDQTAGARPCGSCSRREWSRRHAAKRTARSRQRPDPPSAGCDPSAPPPYAGSLRITARRLAEHGVAALPGFFGCRLSKSHLRPIRAHQARLQWPEQDCCHRAARPDRRPPCRPPTSTVSDLSETSINRPRRGSNDRVRRDATNQSTSTPSLPGSCRRGRITDCNPIRFNFKQNPPRKKFPGARKSLPGKCLPIGSPDR
jgi:hypothetical protein